MVDKFPKDIKINGETELKDWREDVEEGYYFYKNRFKNNYDLEERIVPNYTLAVYDETNKKLYYYQYDS